MIAWLVALVEASLLENSIQRKNTSSIVNKMYSLGHVHLNVDAIQLEMRHN